MATVTVHLPMILTTGAAIDAARAGAVDGVNLALEEIVGRIKLGGDVPVDRGPLRAGLTRTPAAFTGANVTAAIVSSGVSNKYADVQETGRRAGARNPPSAAIVAWVKRARADMVQERALALQAQYAQAHPGKHKGKSRAIRKYQERAAYLIARGVVKKLRARGMQGRRFVARQFEGANGGAGGALIRERCEQMIGNRLRALQGGA